MHYLSKFLGGQSKKRSPKRVKLALVGFGRTGTTSLVRALQQVGYTFLHDDTLVEVADLHRDLWVKDIDMEQFVAECGNRGFDAIFFFSDDFLKWVAEAQDVKVVLSKRDSGRKWAESWLLVTPMVDYFHSRPFIWSPLAESLLPGYFDLIYKNISTQGQPEKYKDLDTLAAAYDAHLVKVRRMVPAERLLEFNVKEGWEPLCEFLGIPVPKTSFPHVNDRAVVRSLVATFWLVTWIWPLGPLLIIYLGQRLLRGLARRISASAASATKKAN